MTYFHVRKEDVHARSAAEADPPFASFDVVLRRDYDYLREDLMRCGLLAMSERLDGCISKTAAQRIRDIAHRACWPALGPGAGE